MKTLFKEDGEQNGVELSEYEAKLLMRLCDRLPLDFIRSKGFDDEEAMTIIRWASAI